jgi:hypothetical protein
VHEGPAAKNGGSGLLGPSGQWVSFGFTENRATGGLRPSAVSPVAGNGFWPTEYPPSNRWVPRVTSSGSHGFELMGHGFTDRRFRSGHWRPSSPPSENMEDRTSGHSRVLWFPGLPRASDPPRLPAFSSISALYFTLLFSLCLNSLSLGQKGRKKKK